ncbi:TPA: hypothetical protein EYP83_03965 [Candidatus Geothermarchaeota archaeon]|nr:hypothetical protein [Candidatus Geothermarchaeota archaeon]
MKIEDIQDSISIYELGSIFNRPSIASVSREEILLLIKSISHKLRDEIDEVDIDRVVEAYIDVYGGSTFLDPSLKMYLEPETPLDVYPIVDYKSLLESFDLDILAGLDSSSHSPRGHGDPLYLLVNVGFNIWSPALDTTRDRGYIPYFVLIKNYELDLRAIEKYVEQLSIKAFIEYLVDLKNDLGARDLYILFDESFNLGYTYSFAKELRDLFIEMYKDLFRFLDSNKVLYSGVFYSGSTLISKVLKKQGIIDYEVRDRVVMDRYLDGGSHSQVFHIHSDALEEHGLDIYTVYLKVSDYNVLRIEFPSRIYRSGRYIDVIRAIYLDAIRGDGYPYLLGKAHESCVLRGDIRRFIEIDVANVLWGSYIKSISGKNIRKWRRII